MSMTEVVEQAQEYMQAQGIGGWLLYDYRGMNPILEDTIGRVGHVTRPVWIWIPARGSPHILASFVDQGRFGHLGLDTTLFVNHADMIDKLKKLITSSARIAMEYTPEGRASSRFQGGRRNAGDGEGDSAWRSSRRLICSSMRRTTVEREPSSESHLFAAEKLTQIVKEAFRYIGDSVQSGVTEHEVAEFIRNRFLEEGLIVTDGPAVAVNEHASDPHFDPTPETSVRIKQGDWVLIDLWSRLPDEDAMFGDITWTAYVGNRVPTKHQEVFDVVTGARDAALSEIEREFDESRPLRGWELDKVARNYIDAAGYGEYFNHRLGAQPRQGGTFQRREPGLLGDFRHAPAHSRHRGDDRAGNLRAGVRGAV